MEPKTIFEALILILMALGIVLGLGVLFVTAIMQGFTKYMNRKPRGR